LWLVQCAAIFFVALDAEDINESLRFILKQNICFADLFNEEDDKCVDHPGRMQILDAYQHTLQ